MLNVFDPVALALVLMSKTRLYVFPLLRGLLLAGELVVVKSRLLTKVLVPLRYMSILAVVKYVVDNADVVLKFMVTVLLAKFFR